MIPTQEQIDNIACLDQRSLDWFRARLGCITGSCVHYVMKLSDAEKAYNKAIAVGPVEIESKSDFKTRLSSLKDNKELQDAAKKAGPLKETKEMFAARMDMLAAKANENPFPDTTVSYLNKLASERNLRGAFVNNDDYFGQYLERTSISSSAIRWGEEMEKFARTKYTQLTGYEVAEIGFYRHNTVDWYGDSPDGLVLDNEGRPIGAIEIKCPKSETWIGYMREFRKAEIAYDEIVEKFMKEHQEIDSDSFVDEMLPYEQRKSTIMAETLKRIKPEYYWQCQSHCSCNKVDWCDFIAYDQMQKGEIIIARIYRNDDEINLMHSRIEKANQFIDNEILI